MQKKEQTHRVGDLVITTKSDVFEGKTLDTVVRIDGQVLCYVSGQELNEFIEKLKSLVNEYRI